MSARDKLKELRERKKSSDNIVPDKEFTIKHYYNKIVSNPTKDTVTEACEYYKNAVNDGKKYIVPYGPLSDLVQQLAGITFFYGQVYNDVQQARRWYEGKLDRIEAEKYKYYMYDDSIKQKYGVLKATEASKMVKADKEVNLHYDLVRLLAYHEHMLENLMEQFDNSKFTLNNLVAIHKEGLTAVFVDPTRET